METANDRFCIKAMATVNNDLHTEACKKCVCLICKKMFKLKENTGRRRVAKTWDFIFFVSRARLKQTLGRQTECKISK